MAHRNTPAAHAIPPQPRSRRDFRIAIICALPLEAEMVELVLDVDWSDISSQRFGKAAGDKNAYTTGAIAGHNVVLAHMTGIGGNDAAAAAARLQSSFTSIKLAFVVGICGAVPIHPKTQEEIVLGDCIVSTAIVQFDFGRLGPQGFQKKRGLDALGRAGPEIRSMTAKWSTRRNQQSLTNNLRHHLTNLLNEYPSIRRPDIENDLLFQPSYTHSHRPATNVCDSCRIDLGICDKDCEALGCDRAYLIRRKRLHGNQPRLHFGCFGSANTVLKSGRDRDAMSKADQIVGFEMESSGVWDNLPTVVIKSACDYADSHKNKHWQEYAAATAAAGLKAILEKTELPDEEISAVVDPQTLHQQNRTLSKDEMNCLQAFCLEPSYRDTKDRTPERVEGTCFWFLSQDVYKEWTIRTGGCLLVSADPGCGKSVLAKHLIDNELPISHTHARICYYFFKDQIQDRLAPALCAILHQILSQENDLLMKCAVPEYQKHGNTIVNNIGALSDVLMKVLGESTSQFIIVFDALDECDATDCQNLFRLLGRLNPITNLKIILTSRPYDTIISQYQTRVISSRLHIPGEESCDAISAEVNLVIKHRLQDLYLRNRFDERVRQDLEHRLLSEAHRTYLWVYLVFDELERGLKKTQMEMQSFLKTLPRTVNEAYEKILSRFTHDPETRRAVLQALCMMLAATKPLTVCQMQTAIKIPLQPPTQSYDELDLESVADFGIKLRNWCGLFIQIHNQKIVFIHQTAREFLLSQTSECTSELMTLNKWCGSISAKYSHNIAAQICITCLEIKNAGEGLDATGFHYYASQHWSKHFDAGHLGANRALFDRAFALCDPRFKATKAWLSQVNVIGTSLLEYIEQFKGQAAVLLIVSFLDSGIFLQRVLADAESDAMILLPAFWAAVPLAGPERPGNLIQLLDFGKKHNFPMDQSIIVWI